MTNRIMMNKLIAITIIAITSSLCSNMSASENNSEKNDKLPSMHDIINKNYKKRIQELIKQHWRLPLELRLP